MVLRLGSSHSPPHRALQDSYALSSGWRRHIDFLAWASGPRYIPCNYNPSQRLMTIETLRIRNFAGLTDVEIDETHRVHEHASSAIVRARKPL